MRHFVLLFVVSAAACRSSAKIIVTSEGESVIVTLLQNEKVIAQGTTPLEHEVAVSRGLLAGPARVEVVAETRDGYLVGSRSWMRGDAEVREQFFEVTPRTARARVGSFLLRRDDELHLHLTTAPPAK